MRRSDVFLPLFSGLALLYLFPKDVGADTDYMCCCTPFRCEGVANGCDPPIACAGPGVCYETFDWCLAVCNIYCSGNQVNNGDESICDGAVSPIGCNHDAPEATEHNEWGPPLSAVIAIRMGLGIAFAVAFAIS